MHLITENYRALNKELHAKGAYGAGGFRWADMVLGLRSETESTSVLDYGCGQGNLGKALGSPDWFREYDPAIEGKDIEPKPADLVICTDVLEHIEPDMLDNVLKHIANLSLRAVFLVISIVPAQKKLPDGRNAHLSVHSADWWRERLEKLFIVSHWDALAHQVVMAGTTVREITNIVAKSAVSDTIRFDQAARNCPLVERRVTAVPRHDRRAAIVCYGPTLKDTWRTLFAERKVFGAAIVSVSGAHDFLIERGIVPDIHIECDPREHKAFFTRSPHPDVDYWVASCCHPKLVDQLRGNKRALWHVYNSEVDRQIIAPDGPDPGSYLLCGAGTVGSRAVNLMYVAGYRSFSIYGMDCSFASDGEQHAGTHSGKVQHEWPVKVGGRWFRTSGNLVYTAQGFMENMRVLSQASRINGEPFIDGTDKYIEMFLHGDGLLAHMYCVAMETAVAA